MGKEIFEEFISFASGKKTNKREKIILATKVAGPSREYLRDGGYIKKK